MWARYAVHSGYRPISHYRNSPENFNDPDKMSTLHKAKIPTWLHLLHTNASFAIQPAGRNETSAPPFFLMAQLALYDVAERDCFQQRHFPHFTCSVCYVTIPLAGETQNPQNRDRTPSQTCQYVNEILENWDCPGSLGHMETLYS